MPSRSSAPATTLRRSGRALLLALCVAAATVAATPADAHRHDPQRGGHPLRIAAYALHPVGYFLDVVFVRPAHWLISRESLAPIFGHTKN